VGLSFNTAGTAYVSSQSVTGSTYTNYITVVDPHNPLSSKNYTLPGTNASITPQVGLDGHLYTLTSVPTSTAGVSTYYLSTIDPASTALKSISLGALKSASFPYSYSYSSQYNYLDIGYQYSYEAYDQTVAPDGSTYINVTNANNQSGLMSVNRTYTTHSDVVTLPGASAAQRIIGPDGTSYQFSSTYDYQAGYYTVTAITVIDPDDPTHATSINLAQYPYSTTVKVTDEGTAYFLLNYQVLNGSYVSRIMVFDPADPYHPTIFEVPGAITANDIIANSDGSALVPYYDSGTAKLLRIDTARSYQPPVQP